jgi:C_GCAxxG_C_C family probable redox protein
MKIQTDAVSPEKTAKEAEDLFRNGYFCCEAIMASIRNNFALDVPEEVIAMSSGMAVGAGRSGCMCGALNGGILALGMFFGRTGQNGPKDPQVVKCMALTNELHNWFKEATGKNAVCCRILTREFDMAKGEHKEQCIRFTGLAAKKTAEIIIRELGLKNLDKDEREAVETEPAGCAA